MGVDGAGGQGEGDVPVEARVRREEGPAHRRDARSGPPGGTRSWSGGRPSPPPPAWCARPRRTAAGPGTAGRPAAPSIPPAGGRRRPPRRRSRSRPPARRPPRRRPAPTPTRARPARGGRRPSTSRPSRPSPRRPARSRTDPRERRRRRRRRPRRGRAATPPELDEVVHRGRRHDRDLPARGREASALRLERPHHAVGGGEPERRPAGEHDGVDVLDQPVRVEQRRLATGGRAAAHLTRRDRSLGDGDDGDARPVAGPVADPDSGDVGDQEAASRGASAARTRRAERRRGQNRRSGAPAPRSRANSAMSALTSSVRSSISMWPAPLNTSRRASGMSSAMRRPCAGGAMTSALPLEHERGHPDREAARRSCPGR